MKNRYAEPVIFSFLFIFLLILALIRNFPEGKPWMGGEFWSDKGGYYVYLPALFIYQFDAAKFPDSIDHKSSNGFSLDLKHNKVLTKYPCGVAMLVAPFFLATHLTAAVSGLNTNGFGIIYQWGAVFAGVFYFTLGLFFLKKFLGFYFRKKITYLILLFILTGTNLYFYGMDDVLMSHVYSFFLLSLFLFLVRNIIENPPKKHFFLILSGIVFALALLVRPTNVLFLLIYPFLDVKSFKEVRNRISHIVQIRHLVTLSLVIIIIFLPQMLYWKYAYGSFIHYSYQGEGFTNWLNPKIIEIWFSPLNGLFIYNPLLLFMVAGMALMMMKKIPNGLFVFLFFLFISYLLSSWGIWYYGGCHGSRPFVDFYPLLSLPLGFLLDRIYSGRKWIFKIIIGVFLILFSFYNLKLIYNFQVFTGSTWGWHDFLQTLDRAGMYNLERNRYVFKNDFENITIDNKIPKTTEQYRSGSRSTYMTEEIEYTFHYSKRADDIIRHKMIQKVDLSLWLNPLSTETTEALLVFQIEDTAGKPVLSKIIRADDFLIRIGRWTEIKGTFEVPQGTDPDSEFSFFIWNFGRTRFYIDDVELRFE